MLEVTAERKNSLLTERNLSQNKTEGGHPPRPAGVLEDRKEGTTHTINQDLGYLPRKRITS